MSLSQWSTTAANNATADPTINWQEGQPPSTVNDSARAMMAALAVALMDNREWLMFGDTPTYVSGTQFTVPGNLTARYAVGRRVRTFNTGGTLYGIISGSAFASVTTVTVALDSGSLDSGLSEVDVGLLNASNPSLPAAAPAPVSKSGAYSLLASDFDRLITVTASGAQTLPTTASVPDGWRSSIYNASTIASPISVPVVIQGADRIDADSAFTVYVLPGETVEFRKFGSKFYTRGRSLKGRIVQSQTFFDAGSITSSTSFVGAQGANFTFQPISPRSLIHIYMMFEGNIQNIAANNTTGSFQVYETTSGQTPIGLGAYQIAALSGAGGVGSKAPCALNVIGIVNSALTPRLFDLFQASSGSGAIVSADNIVATINEVMNV